jgi:hypothetical protein
MRAGGVVNRVTEHYNVSVLAIVISRHYIVDEQPASIIRRQPENIVAFGQYIEVS